MKLIVGLGNPGEKYENTRHNLGFLVLDHLLKDLGTSKIEWDSSNKLKSDIALFTLHKEKVILAKPQTYMNNSGMAVQLLKDFYKVEPEDLWIVYDELDLPLGSIKIRFGGAAAGHHGVESIMEAIGTDKFWRYRLGISATTHFLVRHQHLLQKLVNVLMTKVNGGHSMIICTSISPMNLIPRCILMII